MNTHKGIKNYKCDVCERKFVDSTRLKQHKWIHSKTKAFQCEHCDKSFRHKNHLLNHIASTHPDLDQSKFKCAKCDRKFAFKYKLDSHMKWHELDQIQKVECENNQYSLLDMNILTEKN